MAGNISFAQNTPVGTGYRLVQTKNLEYAVVLDLAADADYTAGSYSNAQIVLLYTDGTTLSQITSGRGNQGTWTEQGPFDHTTVTGIYSQNSTPQFDMTLYQLTNTINLGNCTSGCTDTMIIVSVSPAVSGGVIRLHDGSVVTSGASSLDECLGTQPSPGVNNSGDLDTDGSAGPLTTLQWDVPGTGNAPLPVDLIDFEVLALENHDAQLTWATTSEFQNSHFDIQRSFDGYRFTTIGQVAGNGTSHALIQYTYVDETIPAHENKAFYRLHQVDFDVKSENSDVRLVQFNSSHMETITAYPNPTHDETTLLLSNEVNQGAYPITDLVGKQWAADIIKAGSRSVKMDFSHLPAGVYMATLQTDGIQKHVRIVKY